MLCIVSTVVCYTGVLRKWRCRIMKKIQFASLFMVFIFLTTVAYAENMTGEGPNLGTDRITQAQIEGGLPLEKIIKAGVKVFTTPFNKHDGFGDGHFDHAEGDPRKIGNRPTLGNNGAFLRVNGLDAQTCLECHFVASFSTIPWTIGIGGVAGGNSNVFFMPSYIDVADLNPGQFNGRSINPPFNFGAGGVELLAKEMTYHLQKLKAKAIANPGTVIILKTKGVYFGKIKADYHGNLDTSHVEGIDPDLVVRPFGRKGNNSSLRVFDIGAMQFHFGMQPVEVVGKGMDLDGDGVVNEILVGELSAVHIFQATLLAPFMEELTKKAKMGFGIFKRIGCAKCHIPFLNTKSKHLAFSFPEVETDPMANVYSKVNLIETANFKPNDKGGIIVPLFADLKRHDMGPGLAESLDLVDHKENREFTTARLWGVRDTVPYLHDGRALTLTEAILMHGGEGQNARDKFDALSETRKNKVISFLYSLRTPVE